ncbi:MAG TPA: DUF1579 domain-containing protein [Planctomycetota bacterium]|nr:DUF1579 domain-containing protein [Planctomycetota bacterium]
MLSLLAAVLLQQDVYAKPVKEHAFLKNFEGEWETTSKMLMGGPEPVVAKGKESSRLIAGGLFLITDMEAEIFGGTFVGHATRCYDVHKKKFTGSWVDNMATGVYTLEGTLDETGKVLTEWIEGANPQTGEPMKMKMTTTVKDKDSHTSRFFMTGPDGKEMEMGSVEYVRKK